MKILWDDRAWEDYLYWQTKPEPLKDNLAGWWSRRIDEENRIVYKETDGCIIVAACRGHYDNIT